MRLRIVKIVTTIAPLILRWAVVITLARRFSTFFRLIRLPSAMPRIGTTIAARYVPDPQALAKRLKDEAIKTLKYSSKATIAINWIGRSPLAASSG
jgi:hypothetical protein